MLGDPKKMAAIIVSRLHPAEAHDDGKDADEGSDLVDLADEFLSAVESKDAERVADCFKAMFQACESEPHDEYED